ALWLAPAWIAWPLVGLTLWMAMFFRDPVRAVPQDNRIIISPADGLVTLIRTVMPPLEMQGEGGLTSDYCTRVSIFMSVFDVHINRAPIGGTVNMVAHIGGAFRNAGDDAASEVNERQHYVFVRPDGLRVGMTQIAGLVARRIIGFVKIGDIVAPGQRIGLIRFGSRVDVYLPPDTAARVAIGQRCIAGETILGFIADTSSASAVRQ
ncbi:MAG: phosphatidylserine decarboxylase, partial [Alphaproteobacteria bacterium]|nr:phosphatidylserine decarboxylase [Alphaproteobacteria bacterium]